MLDAIAFALDVPFAEAVQWARSWLGEDDRPRPAYDFRPLGRTRRLNPYQPATDTGLLKILALVTGVILIVFSGALDCRFALIPLGFC